MLVREKSVEQYGAGIWSAERPPGYMLSRSVAVSGFSNKNLQYKNFQIKLFWKKIGNFEKLDWKNVIGNFFD